MTKRTKKGTTQPRKITPTKKKLRKNYFKKIRLKCRGFDVCENRRSGFSRKR